MALNTLLPGLSKTICDFYFDFKKKNQRNIYVKFK